MDAVIIPQYVSRDVFIEIVAQDSGFKGLLGGVPMHVALGFVPLLGYFFSRKNQAGIIKVD